ncbi:glycosyltransferase family 4 protein [Humisphaera borealis]|uniref:Glycosyltransferase family 4 protein n=1 Tax=Humisphaera borealis TaxID=2807512 RepID=A0A7M2WVF8_9BACT|nr:glycosyltransferase family 4 protein [Humisphaera borealis]QOV88821.1 glycosyltransferase family 4 protein [Humisphaera borealis]
MNILVAHNFYQRPGGEDQVFADETSLLKSAGHQVTEFTVHNDSVAGQGKLALVGKTLWNRDTARQIADLVQRHRVDVVHFHNTFPLISPASYYAARSAGAAVVQTLHNYRLLCPGSLFLRDGKVCEDCLGKTLPWPGAVHKCYRGDRGASTVTAGMLGVHRMVRTYHHAVDRYVALTEFAREKFSQGGFPRHKIVVKPNFILDDRGAGSGAGGYALYVGRLDEGKGIEVLLPAWKQVRGDFKLRILGDGMQADLVRQAMAADPRIEWLGRRPMDEVYASMGDAAFMVLSSVWYEGLPKTVCEAFSRGTPIVASNLGALSELISHEKTGLHFTPGDPTDLARQLQWGLEHREALGAMRVNCRKTFEERYTAAANIGMLAAVYEGAIASRRVRLGGRAG